MWLSRDSAEALVHWRDPRDSGIVFGSVLVVLIALRYLSVISVIGNLALALVTATMAFRIYKCVLAAINKTQDGHPFKQLLETDVALPADKVSALAESLNRSFDCLITHLKTVFLVKDAIESIKFAVQMYLLTYVGAWINGQTLVILAWIGVFAVPKVYQDNQKQIDDAFGPIKAKLDEVSAKFKSIVPASVGGKAAAAAADKKEE